MDAFSNGGIRVINPPVRLPGGSSAGPLGWGRHGGKFAGLAVEQGKIAAHDVRPHFRISRRKPAAQDAPVVLDRGRDAVVENVRVLANRYKAQKSMLKDVLQAQSQLEEATDQTRQALLTFWTAKAEFENAIGKDQ